MSKRKDLIYTGRTLFGAKPPKGQELEDHYFGAIKPRVHGLYGGAGRGAVEAGHPRQDRAQRGRARAARAGPDLYHDQHRHRPQPAHDGDDEEGRRPARAWSACCTRSRSPASTAAASTTTGRCPPIPASTCWSRAKSPYENAQFLLFLCAVIKAVDEYQDLLRVSVASAGNDHRLGGNEAPPAIVSMFLGDELTEILEAIESDSEL